MNNRIPPSHSHVFIVLFDLVVSKPYLIDPTLISLSKSNEYHAKLSRNYGDKCSLNNLFYNRDSKIKARLTNSGDTTKIKALHYMTLHQTVSGYQNEWAANANIFLRGGGGEDALAIPGDLVVPSSFPSIQVHHFALFERIRSQS